MVSNDHTTMFDQAGFRSAAGLSAAVTIMALLFVLILWQAVKRHDEAMIHNMLADEIQLLRDGMGKSVSEPLHALQRMASRWEVNRGTPRESWRKDAANYLIDYPGLRSVQWVDDTWRERWIESLGAKQERLSFNRSDQRWRAALNDAKDTRTSWITPPIEFEQDGKGFLAFYPTHINGTFSGFIVGVFDIKELVTEMLPVPFISRHSMRIRIAGELVLAVGWESQAYINKWQQHTTLQLVGSEWELAVWPKPTFQKDSHRLLPVLIWVGGGMLSLILGITLYVALTARQQNRLLRQQNRTL